jgi:hypothetical protein
LAWQFDGTTGPYIGSVSSTTQRGTLNYVPGKYISALNIQNPTGTTSNSINWNFGTQTFSIDAGFSFSCWVRFNDLSYLAVIQQFITFYNGTSNSLRIQLNATQGLMQTQFTDSTANLKSVNMFTPVTGTWYHLTCVGSNGNITVYLNGTTTYGPLANVQSGITFNNASLGLATSFAIYPVTNADFDDFRVFNTALSAAQVQSIYASQGMPGRGVSNNKSFSIPTVSGYTYVPLYALPTSFTMVNTLTSNAWTYGGGVLTDGGTNPVLNLVATSPGDIYSATNPGIWYALNRLGSTTEYVRHQGFTMKLSAYTAANFDFAWAFFLKNGTTNQVIVYNTYNGGYWVQSNGINIRIGTQVQAEANVYTISSTVNNPPMKLTGTPLFSQLSASAIASSVGAFSLRAVNGSSTGGTAKAVNVAPGGAFPITGFSTSATQSTNQFTQNLSGAPFSGNYAANCSSFYLASGTEQPWRCFDKNNNGTWWTTSTGIYSGTTGVYTGAISTTISGSAYLGEWISIQFPNPIILITYTIYNSSSWNSRAPNSFKVAGSNDGTTWTLVDTQTGITSWASSTTSITFTPSAQATAYSYYRLCVNQINGGQVFLTIGEWILNGTVPSLSSDFYADRLGNLLTRPVVGQTLVNWIGGATGYVTTWYDQSGAGNDMSCSIAGIQPKIDLVNGFIDFKPSAYFDVSSGTTGPVPFNSSKNYTVVFRHGQFIGSGLFCATQNAAGPYGNLVNNFKKGTGATYTQYWYGNDVNNKGVLATGNRVSYKWDGTNRSLYVNGSLVDASVSSGWAQTSSQIQMIGKTNFDAAMNGELYAAFMFTSAVSDADRTLVENFT